MPTLTQLSPTLSPRGRDALAVLLAQSGLFRYLENHSAFVESATEFETMPVTGEQPVQQRPLNGGYNAENVPLPARVADELSFNGFELKIDRSIREDARRGLRNVDRYLATKLPKKQKSFARGIEVVGMAGDSGVSALQPDGFATILDGSAVPGLGGATLTISATAFLSGAGDHYDLSDYGDVANYRRFKQKLYEAIMEYCPNANGLVMNPAFRGVLTTILETTHSLDQTRNLFGQQVEAFAGMELVGVRKEAITTTEPDQAGAAVTTSLYAMEAGPGMVNVHTNSGLEYHDWDDESADEEDDTLRYTERCEVRMQPAIEDDEAALRITDIKL